MISKKNLFLTIITLPALIIAFLSISSVSIAHTHGECDRDCSNNCNASQDLDKSLEKNHATVTNFSTNSCEYEVTLALYDSTLQGALEDQVYINHVTKTVKPGETVDFLVEDTGKACYKQSDLFLGSEIKKPPYYENNLASNVYEVPCETPTVTPEFTPTPTEVITTETPTPTEIINSGTPIPTESITPTETPTPVPPTETPGQGPTSTPGPGSSSSSSSSSPAPAVAAASLASTGDATLIYIIVLAGAISLISGLIMKKFNR